MRYAIILSLFLCVPPAVFAESPKKPTPDNVDKEFWDELYSLFGSIRSLSDKVDKALELAKAAQYFEGLRDGLVFSCLVWLVIRDRK